MGQTIFHVNDTEDMAEGEGDWDEQRGTLVDVEAVSGPQWTENI